MSDVARPTYPAATMYREGVAEGYVALRQTDAAWAWENEEVRTFVASLPSGLDVLDVPVGTGRYIPLYLDAGWNVHGCDISADMLAAAERQLGERYAQCDMVVGAAERTPFADASMDVIVSGRFFHWLPDQAAIDTVLAELARVGRGELFVELILPALRAPVPTFWRSVRQVAGVVRRKLQPAEAARRAAQLPTYHAESDVLASADRHGWRLVSIGVECPAGPGVRFYRFTRAG